MNEIMNMGYSVFTYGLVNFLVTCLVCFIATLILNKYIDKILNRMKIKKSTQNERDIQSTSTTIDFLGKIIKVIIKATIIFIVLTQVKIFANLGSTIIGATGVFALALGLAAQESASTLIGGFFLSFYKPFIKGDLVYLPEKNLAGRVIEVGLRHTIILTINNSRIIVPNNIMNSAIIENRDEDSFYTNVYVYSIAYGADYKLAIKLIHEMLDNNELAFKDGRDIVVSELNSSSVDLKVIVKTRDLPTGLQLNYQLNEQVLDVFKEHNIEIPYNTQTIHVINSKD